MVILGIESTCDETGVAVVEDGQKILSNVVSSSAELHQKYAGIVPEIAAREQTHVIIPVITEALSQVYPHITSQNLSSHVSFPISKIDAIAVANGPGLVGSLLIGVETAKTLALVWNKPLIPVNHLIGHVYANWLIADSSQLTEKNYEPLTVNREPIFPLVALIVSGGHTDLLLMTHHGKYKWLGGTLDDAAGEAFDKVARVLGLGYPGGPEIEKVAGSWSLVTSNQKLTTSYRLPRPLINSVNFDFSFSGLKTAVVNLVHSSQLTVYSREEIAHEFQNAICDVLVSKTIKAAKKYKVKSIIVGGGVAANNFLREKFRVKSSESGIQVFFPPKKLSIDNAAMIASAAFFHREVIDTQKLQADANLYFTASK